jgi:hypothetical protein
MACSPYKLWQMEKKYLNRCKTGQPHHINNLFFSKNSKSNSVQLKYVHNDTNKKRICGLEKDDLASVTMLYIITMT